MADDELTTTPDSSEFLMMVGKCITDWARIEELLFYMTQDILSVTKEQCSIIYYRTPIIETRLQLVDEILVDALPKPERKDGGHVHTDVKSWRDILADIREELPVRNRLAHHPVSWGLFEADNEKGDKDYKVDVLSFPPHTELARGKSGEKKPLILNDLTKYQSRVLALYNRLNAFRRVELKAQIAERAQREAESKKAPVDPWRGPDG